MVLALVAVLAVGCAPKGPAIGGVLYRSMIGNPNLFNPILSSDTASSAVEGHIFEGLVRYDENMQRVGQLAERWEISDNNLEWTFFLRQDVNWQDGEKFTAHDVVFTIGTTAFHPDYPGPRASMFNLVEDIVAVDDHTVKFILSAPFGPFMNNVGFSIIPRHIFDPEVATGANKVAIADMMSHPMNWDPMGTGPYKYGEWQEGEFITVVRNENYYNGNYPYIETVYWKFIEDLNTAVSALEAGEIDIFAGIPDDDLDRVKANLEGTHNFYSYQDLGYDYLGLNFRPEAFGEGRINPWLDRNVRRAIAHALNRKEFVDTILHGRGVLMHSHVPPVSWAYNDDATMKYEYNPEKAGQLLDQAGWKMESDGWRYKDGQKFTFQLTTNAGNNRRETIGILTQEDLKQVGIDVELNYIEWSHLLNNYVYPGTFEVIIIGWSLGADPDAYSIFHSSQSESGLNFGKYENPQIDEILIRGRETVDIEERKVIYAEMQKILSEELPYIFLFSRQLTAAAHMRVHDITPSALGLWWFERWYIEE
jgi:peptide/nickel transport system substrate-binding protein